MHVLKMHVSHVLVTSCSLNIVFPVTGKIRHRDISDFLGVTKQVQSMGQELILGWVVSAIMSLRGMCSLKNIMFRD